ncbi:type II secretion system protein GspG [Candidatus Aerophobetes bacterium]|nr:type II secretion system protein GspG [Candidatus Aerophobetes bacterium]
MELLITVAIIFILATIITINLIRATNQAKRAEARTFIGKLELAISMYKIDTGTYPPDDESSASLRRALNPDKHDPIRDIPGWKGPYLEFRDNEVNSAGELVDPWHKGKDDRNNVYTYRANLDNDPTTFPPFHNTTTFDIYSKGSDGKTGTGFDAGNYCQNGLDDDGDGLIDELDPYKDKNGYLEDDINNW